MVALLCFLDRRGVLTLTRVLRYTISSGLAAGSGARVVPLLEFEA